VIRRGVFALIALWLHCLDRQVGLEQVLNALLIVELWKQKMVSRHL
jgi:hypothetical protein